MTRHWKHFLPKYLVINNFVYVTKVTRRSPTQWTLITLFRKNRAQPCWFFFLSDVNSFVRSFDGFLVSAQQHPAIDTLVLTGQPKIIKTMLFMSLIKRILGHAYYIYIYIMIMRRSINSRYDRVLQSSDHYKIMNGAAWEK